MKTFDVKAHWDGNAAVWWVNSDDIPGLVSEAGTFEKLDETIQLVAADLLRLNLGFDDVFEINLIEEPA